ncbi:hypothetical protein A3Q56_00429 [Intoshia linei]|uniref:Uncharacterized protein n=1 Tax=Intoshia linei TaxID=1819745 RepID=A0A177BBV5_9BILA|nr:hypothetical protein A3Q56_00429 [Intoshia linei]
MASLRNHLKMHGDLDNVSGTPKITSILAIKKDEKFPSLPYIDRQVYYLIATCCCNHVLPFNIVEDPIFQ